MVVTAVVRSFICCHLLGWDLGVRLIEVIVILCTAHLIMQVKS